MTIKYFAIIDPKAITHQTVDGQDRHYSRVRTVTTDPTVFANIIQTLQKEADLARAAGEHEFVTITEDIIRELVVEEFNSVRAVLDKMIELGVLPTVADNTAAVIERLDEVNTTLDLALEYVISDVLAGGKEGGVPGLSSIPKDDQEDYLRQMQDFPRITPLQLYAALTYQNKMMGGMDDNSNMASFNEMFPGLDHNSRLN